MATPRRFSMADHIPISNNLGVRTSFAVEWDALGQPQHAAHISQDLDDAVARVKDIAESQSSKANYKFLGSVPWVSIVDWMNKNAPGPDMWHRFATDRDLKRRFMQDFLTNDHSKLLAQSPGKVRADFQLR